MLEYIFFDQTLLDRFTDYLTVREIHFQVLPLVRALFCEPNPTAIKQALNWMGVPVGGTRLPLAGMTPKGKDTLREAMVKLGKARPEDCI